MKLHNLYQNLWADSLCINQEEKRRSNYLTWIQHVQGRQWWLPALDHLVQTRNCCRMTGYPSGKSCRPKIAGPCVALLPDEVTFARIWTVQECISARKFDIICGCSRISFELLSSRLEIPWRVSIREGQLSDLVKFVLE